MLIKTTEYIENDNFFPLEYEKEFINILIGTLFGFFSKIILINKV